MYPLLDRLRERKLVQWALAYLGGAWLVLQVLGEAADAFSLSPTVLRIGWALLGVGFVTALVLAWFHGEKGVQRVSGTELLVLSALLIVAGGTVWLVGGTNAEGNRNTTAPGAAEPSGAILTSSVPLERSIAVLPFDNLSESKENEYFSDGITDEILTTLANVGDLRVISRTSVMQYKDTEKPLRQIASELGVAHVLEGSVQRAGNQVRINAQLIDAKTDAHLWAQRYDRPLQDVFAVQSEIAQQIAQALQAKLSPAEQKRLERQPTANLAAYDLVLRGQDLARRTNPESNEAALSFFRRARELDPSYPDAYAGLAAASYWQYWWTGERMWLDSALVAARRAVTLDPAYAQGHAELGWTLNLVGEAEQALEATHRAVQLNPNLSEGLATVNHFLLGRMDEAARWWRPALQRDPSNSFLSTLAGNTYLHLGMPAQARVLYERAIRINPEFSWAHYHAGLSYLLEGRHQEARVQIQRMLEATDSAPNALVWAGHAAASLGDLVAARRFFEQGLPAARDWEKAQGALTLAWILQQSGESENARKLVQDASRRFRKRWGGKANRPQDFAEQARIEVLRGDREQAIRAMEEGVRQGWRFIHERPSDPLLNSLRGDPRYDRLMAQVKADIDRQRARVEREGW